MAESSKKQKEKLLIIDAHALIHRAYHALPPLTTTSGQSIGAVYGFVRILVSALKTVNPTHVAVTFDSKGKTFRHEMYPEYKANRDAPPEDLVSQFPLVRTVVESFGYPVYAEAGYEADDLIGTICAQFDGKPGLTTIILTGDMDMLQLVDKDTKVMRLHKGVKETILYDEALVQSKHQLTPSQIIDYKALRGDSSDNIPGVRGIGEKGATTLLLEYGTVESVFEHAEEVTGRNKKPLLAEGAKESAMLSKELATISGEAPITFNIEDALIESYDEQKITAVFQDYEFASLLREVQQLPGFIRQEGLFASLNENKKEGATDTPAQEEKMTLPGNMTTENGVIKKAGFDYHLVEDEDDIESLIAVLEKQDVFAFDTETTGLNPLVDELVGISFSWHEGQGWYLPCGMNVPEPLAAVFANPNIKKVAHNAKFDIKVLHHAGVAVEGLYYDTMLASYLLNAGSRGHGLNNLAFVEFGHQMQPIEDLIGKGRNQISMAEVPAEKTAWYAAEDADFTWRLFKKYEPLLEREGLAELLHSLEIPIITILAGMEEAGVKLDTDFLAGMSKELHTRIGTIEKEIHSLAGREFNVASSVQMKEILFDVLALPTAKIKKTKTGFSTAASELEKLRDSHPIIPLIEEHRELSKLTSTYLDALPKLVLENTGRIHTVFNQTIAATGRLSSTNPNLQNIPIRTELGREIRKAFIPEKDYRIVAIDYSQIELRVVAHLAEDPVMIEAFKQGQDIHARTAAELNDIALEDVSKDLRRQAKSINFGILYGMGVRGIMRDSGISRDEAKMFLDKYFEVHKGIAAYIENVKQFAHQHGFTKTLFDRRRPLPDIQSGNRMLQAAAERAAVNMPVQGSAADIMKLAMIAVQHAIDAGEIQATMLLQVHDELVFEIQKDIAEAEAAKIQEIMENVYTLKVPLLVDVEIGENWGTLETLH